MRASRMAARQALPANMILAPRRLTGPAWIHASAQIEGGRLWTRIISKKKQRFVCDDPCQDIEAWPDLIEAGALEVRDISDLPGPRNGRVVKAGFDTSTTAALYIQRHLIALGGLLTVSEHDAIGNAIKSWAVH
jgi:hypothetical protein